MKTDLLPCHCEQLEYVPAEDLLKDCVEHRSELFTTSDKEAEVAIHQLPSLNG